MDFNTQINQWMEAVNRIPKDELAAWGCIGVGIIVILVSLLI